METAKLKRFAQFARRTLIALVSSKLKLVLADASAARRENAAAVRKLEEQIELHDTAQVIERVAYTWFNRFCALRFIDVNRYTGIRVVSPEAGQFQPEILAEAKMGHIDEEMVPVKTRQLIFDLLDGKSPSRDPQGEAYRLLVVAVCNFWNTAMPFLFERIEDYTELLMPDDLLSGSSMLAYTREAMTPDVCQDVEVIGWLYQFYISEKKDEVFDGLKKNKKITPENIPAATQLFTPHWIVRYLVENSLGRLWMLNRPHSKLLEKMGYYIKPEQPETDFLKIGTPEEIRICDPACGSGHMLVYAFDLLYAIYEEEGYPSNQIPEKILSLNLFGIEIDERAGELAAFALTMKACAKKNRFLRKPVQPNICVLENVQFDDSEIQGYMDFVGRNLFTAPLTKTLHQFEESNTFGSLIRPELANVESILSVIKEKDPSTNLFLDQIHQKVLRVLNQAEYLRTKYHVVVANPPYLGGKGMSGRLAAWLKDNYSEFKFDLFAAFIVRNSELALHRGQLGFMSPFVWMFISSYEDLRHFLINQKTITSLIQLEYSGFEGATVPICTFTLENAHNNDFRGGYVRLSDFRGSEQQAPKTLEAIKNPKCGWFYRASAADFKKIPGSPIAYWITDRMRNLFHDLSSVSEALVVTGGMTTADNDRFLRLWHEVSEEASFRTCLTRDEAQKSRKKWFPYNKGGGYRKWFGNRDYYVNWYNDGAEILATGRAFPRSREYYFKQSLTYTATSSSYFGIRYSDPGFLFDAKGSSCFADSTRTLLVGLGFLASKIATFLLKCINPTIEFQTGNISILPFKQECDVDSIVSAAIDIARSDWDAYETSWDFSGMPLLHPYNRTSTLGAAYSKYRTGCQAMTKKIRQMEEDNNRILINAYGLQEELTPEVSLSEITLTSNPQFRYGGNKSEIELEALFRSDTMKEFISYAVGCMFGRYALEQSGLILANQGQTLDDYLKQIPEPSFPAEVDNVIPMLEGDWFTDDVTERFRTFLRVTFGEQHFQENLNFVEEAIGKDIRTYFVKDFYNDHLKRYKKRPIYWLFSSPKGSFNALIYMHRYRPDTVSIVLNKYLREFRTKLTSRLDHLKRVDVSADASKSEKTKALKESEGLKKTIAELEAWERDVLYPLATKQIEIDLDDGVKVNYAKFGAALKKIPGLDASEE